MSTTVAELDRMVAILAHYFPVVPGRTLTLLKGSATYSRPWSLAERDDANGSIYGVMTLGTTKKDAANTLNAMIYCFTL